MPPSSTDSSTNRTSDRKGAIEKTENYKASPPVKRKHRTTHLRLGATAKVTGDEIIDDLVRTVVGFWAGRTPWLKYHGARRLGVIVTSQICNLVLRQNNGFIATGTFFRQCRFKVQSKDPSEIPWRDSFIGRKAHGLLNGKEVEAVEQWRGGQFEKSQRAGRTSALRKFHVNAKPSVTRHSLVPDRILGTTFANALEIHQGTMQRNDNCRTHSRALSE
ncbi:hypothetical protein EDD85DRAFT_785169 [Armillaria nabsnona]|nr:hypothetical protein EDD85DRAFT_785169 [Armillaria nabsnona]